MPTSRRLKRNRDFPERAYPASRGFSLVSQRCTAIIFAVLAARVLFWLFLCRGKDLCRQPFGIPVEHAH